MFIQRLICEQYKCHSFWLLSGDRIKQSTWGNRGNIIPLILEFSSLNFPGVKSHQGTLRWDDLQKSMHHTVGNSMQCIMEKEQELSFYDQYLQLLLIKWKVQQWSSMEAAGQCCQSDQWTRCHCSEEEPKRLEAWKTPH